MNPTKTRGIAERQVETDKEDAISRQAYLLAFVVHLGKRSRKSAGEQKTCVFSPNVIDLTLKLGQMEIHGSMQIREWVLFPPCIPNNSDYRKPWPYLICIASLFG